MFGNYFYHQRMRRSVAMFGKMFNDIYVLRKNSSNEVISTVKVPLAYAPRQKFLDRIRQQADLNADQQVAIKLPRMSFEITSISYDPSRQLQKTNKVLRSGDDAQHRASIKSHVPYILSFQLSIFTKTQDDGLQIVEQILPYFNPQYTMSIKPLDGYSDIVEDVPLTLSGVDFQDDYEGLVEQRRSIIYTLTFEMKVNFYGPITQGSVITKVIPKIDINTKDISDSDTLTITITPTPEGVSADSDYGFLESYEYH
tara:strand:- start:981 stop:1745 length:765 start_codon:yes stop_codon:yes gene_type:complete